MTELPKGNMICKLRISNTVLKYYQVDVELMQYGCFKLF